jgi:hypothetical protein
LTLPYLAASFSKASPPALSSLKKALAVENIVNISSLHDLTRSKAIFCTLVGSLIVQ